MPVLFHCAASHRGNLMADMKPESEQRTQRQMTLRLVLPLLVLAGVVFRRLGDSSF